MKNIHADVRVWRVNVSLGKVTQLGNVSYGRGKRP